MFLIHCVIAGLTRSLLVRRCRIEYGMTRYVLIHCVIAGLTRNLLVRRCRIEYGMTRYVLIHCVIAGLTRSLLVRRCRIEYGMTRYVFNPLRHCGLDPQSSCDEMLHSVRHEPLVS